jgi:DNA polymerase V
MTMIEGEPQKHGGRRAGAGRKPKPDQVTKVIRVPKARIPDIKALLQDKCKINTYLNSHSHPSWTL